MKFLNTKVGEVLSSTMYLTVKAISTQTDSIEVEDIDGKRFTIRGSQLIEKSMTSASQYDKEEKVNRTAMAAILSSAGDAVFTVVFEKLDKTERELTGRLVDSENLMGRANVDDLVTTDLARGRRRQVDFRTLKSLILKGTKYTLKK